MQLDKFFETLAYGELGSSSAIDEDTELLLVTKHPKIISYVNRGLTKLYTMFLLKEDVVTVRHLVNKTTYMIHSDFADTVGGIDPYIVDSIFKPFTDNMLMIEYVNDELGEAVVLNDFEDDLSYFTPAFNVVEVNIINPETVFHVVYRAKHEEIVSNPADITKVLVDIPANFEDALAYFVASKYFASINSTDSRKISVSLYQQFMGEVAMLKATGQGAINFNPLPSDVRKSGWL